MTYMAKTIRIALSGCATVFLISCKMTSTPATSHYLTKNGEAASYIVLPENADPIEKHAAAELALFIKKASGAEVRIEKQEVVGLCPIWLRTDAKLKGVTDEGFLIKTDSKGLSITGKTPIGVLYGVYDFLEKHAGCRWFAPYDDCEYVPEAKTIQVAGNSEDRQSPSFQVRGLTPSGGDVYVRGKGIKTTWDWLVRNKIRISVSEFTYNSALHDFLRERGAVISSGGGHETFTKSVPDDKYFKAHPEYFCLVDGKRVPQGVYGESCVEAQVCTSNPDVIRLCAEHILERFDKYPESSFMLGAGDNGPKGSTKWCQCANCVKLDAPGSKSITTRYAVFANAVTKAVHAKSPQAAIWLWAYTQYREPPVGIILDPSLNVRLCMHNRNYKEPLATGPSNKKYLELFQAWRKLANKVTLSEYFGAGESFGTPVWDTLAADLRFYHANGIIGWSDAVRAPKGLYVGRRNTPNKPRQWRGQWQYVYLASKMLWDVNIDENKVLADARKLYYGTTAPAMEHYYTALHDAWQKTPGACGWGAVGGTFTMGKCMQQPGVRAKLEKQLAEAEKLAGDDTTLKHKIQEEKFFYEEYWLKNYELLTKSTVENPTLTPTHAMRPLVIDGRGTDKQWLMVEKYSELMLIKPDGNRKPTNETFVKIMYDDKNIFFLVEAMEKNIKNLTLKSTQRDDPVWKDDSVEIFLYNSKDEGRYWQFCVNPKGVFADSEHQPGNHGNLQFDADAEIRTAVLPDRWMVEARIPAGTFGQNSFEGAGWKVNVCRARKAKGESDPAEQSSLSGYSFHGYERFRNMNFSDPLLGNGSFDEAVEASTNASLRKWEIKGGKIPARWKFYRTGGAAELVMRNDKTGDRFLNISNGWIFQGPFVQWNRHDNNALFSFEAKGTCKLKVAVFRYKLLSKTQTKDSDREFLKMDVLQSLDINSETWKNYACAYKVPDGEIFALVFMVEGTAILDNVVLTASSE